MLTNMTDTDKNVIGILVKLMNADTSLEQFTTISFRAISAMFINLTDCDTSFSEKFVELHDDPRV